MYTKFEDTTSSIWQVSQPPVMHHDAPAAAAALWYGVGQSIYEASPDAIALLDTAGTVLSLNASACRQLAQAGLREGSAWQDLWPASIQPLAEAALEAAREGALGEFQACRTTQGRGSWWDVRLMPVREHGVTAEVIAVARDITREMAACEAAREAQALAEKARETTASIVASIGLEVRTPLKAISGLSHQLLAMQPRPDQQDGLERIEQASQRVALMLDDLVDLVEAENGSLCLHQADFHLGQELDAWIHELSATCGRNNLALWLTVSPELKRAFTGDAARLHQVLASCAAAALRLDGDPSLSVHARIVRRTDPDPLVLFELMRAGSELDAKEIPARLSGSLTGGRCRGGATSFSLALARHLARLMGGDLGVESEPGRGVTFWFTARLSAVRVRGAELAEHSGPSPSLAGRHVLLVKQDAAARDIARQLLEMAGIEVRVAANGREAVDQLAKMKLLDAVLVDMNLPGMGGAELTHHIREQLQLSALPVIVLESKASETDHTACTAAGANDFLAKPVDASKLWSTLARWIAPTPQ